MEIATFILILCLALILTVYNRRQARALEYMARLEEDRAAREIKDRRERKAGDLHVEPLRWLEKMVNPLLDSPLALTDTAKRVVADVGDRRTARKRWPPAARLDPGAPGPAAV